MHLPPLTRLLFGNKIFASIPLLFVVLLLPCAAAVAQSSEDCQACHNDPEFTMERRGRTISLYANPATLKMSPHADLDCVSCHTGFDPENIPHKENIRPVRCTSCHQDAPMEHQFHAVQLSLARKEGTLETACKQCHGTHNVLPLDNPSNPFHSSNMTESCGKCHPDVTSHFAASEHGKALSQGVTGAPTCISCHTRDVTGHQGKLSTLEIKRLQEDLCLECHQDNPDVRKRMGPGVSFIQAYEKSVHGMALKKGNPDAASCVDCHGSHDMRKSYDPESRVHKQHVADDCGQCHSDIMKEFKESIHGQAIARGNYDSPTCITCHGEHNILPVDDPNSPVSLQNLSRETCSPCHSSLRMSEKYGFSASKTRSYEDSYHGLALRGGSTEAANCASCHGVHNIKPSSDPTSMIHKDNLVETCGSCHPNANTRFATGRIHVVEDDRDEDPLLYWISNIYIILIVVIIGGMVGHNVLDFRKKAVTKLKVRRGHLPHHSAGSTLHVRMTLNERIQHATLLISFTVLVITGFMLRFPDAFWAIWIRDLVPYAFETRSLLHRIAGVAILAVSVYHIWYLAATKRGRQLFLDLLPKWKDATDALTSLKYNLGFSEEKPRFERFSYMEKAEYWALVWGNIVMGATGIIMWFDEFFLGIFTKLGYDVSRAIHYYEAWLAMLAILVWHIYFVIFNPDVYPMNLAWLKGTLTEEEMEEEHPLELERIRAKRKEDGVQEDGDMIDIPTTPED
ncbi:MAG: cytochrome b/b6 domain-containing protein [Bacteroidetes bacterium]|nr:cytochrome b/b6 domain-containing protein [Bacteroidota bacterium]